MNHSTRFVIRSVIRTLQEPHRCDYYVVMQVRLVDFIGFTVGSPNIPEPLPCVIVWGNEFFASNQNEPAKRIEDPNYYQVTGYVLADTKEPTNSV